MKVTRDKTLVLISLIALSAPVQSEVLVHWGMFAFDDSETEQDYKGLSPLGEYGIKYRQAISPDFSVSIGAKHTSSVGYREQGKGFNGVYVDFELKVF